MSVLVDTSVWIDHLHVPNAILKKLLLEGKVVAHPAVIGELACGAIKNRTRFLSLLTELPRLGVADFDDVMRMIESERWWGKGLGWMDVQLLAASRNEKALLWTKDRALALAARQAGMVFEGH